MSVELHLPDLPEVPIALGPVAAARGAAPRPRQPWHLRLRDVLSAYLPLLLMTLLALFTWWLVKNTPTAPSITEEAPPRHEPDYTMSQFALEHFDASGRLKIRIEGAQMRHFPDTDRIEIDGVQLRAIAPDGRVTLASAQRALSNGDGSEVQLLGGAQVDSTDAGGRPLQMKSEFLHAFLVSEKLRSHLPVQVLLGGAELWSAGLDYDHGARRLELKGPVRTVLPAPGQR
ncbi:MAG: LPS export ABC transporter periplasmic protein LptC [Rubrivivax sp.]